MALADIAGLQCVICDRLYGTQVDRSCPQCGPEGILEVRFDYSRARKSLNQNPLAAREPGLWRYLELLPVDAAIPQSGLRVGATPTWDVPRLASALGLRNLRLKDEGLNPSGSVEDRSSAVAVGKALENGFTTIACASAGNGASSLAGAAAASGLRAYVFTPRESPEADLIQSQMLGAVAIRVNGTCAEAFRLSEEACAGYGWYNANPGVNPYPIEGRKTAGLEIAETVGADILDWVSVPVGNGCTIAAVWKGLQEMHNLGVLPHRPRMLGVQAERVAPIAEAFHSRRNLEPREGDTIADNIRVSHPANWRKAVRAVRESEGDFVTVSDQEIGEALRLTARLAGLFVDPAAAAAIAGLARAVQERVVTPRDSALAVITATGLKDLRVAQSIANPVLTVDPDLGKLELELARRRRG